MRIVAIEDERECDSMNSLDFIKQQPKSIFYAGERDTVDYTVLSTPMRGVYKINGDSVVCPERCESYWRNPPYFWDACVLVDIDYSLSRNVLGSPAGLPVRAWMEADFRRRKANQEDCAVYAVGDVVQVAIKHWLEDNRERRFFAVPVGLQEFRTKNDNAEAKSDAGKVRLSLVPTGIIRAVARLERMIGVTASKITTMVK